MGLWYRYNKKFPSCTLYKKTQAPTIIQTARAPARAPARARVTARGAAPCSVLCGVCGVTDCGSKPGGSRECCTGAALRTTVVIGVERRCSHEPSPCPPHEAVYRGTTVHGARCVCVHGYAARARARVSARAHRPRPRPPKERAWRGPSRRRAQGVFMLQNRGWGSAKISMLMMRPSSFMMRRQQSTMP
eukprot:scaffold107139_cov36-Phaeocystis_antarctica.AAC.1